MNEKQKHKPITFKQINKSDDNIIKRDERTFYVKSTNPEQEPYMVYNSQSKGWLCDCRDFIFGNTNCKHIKKVKAL